MTYGKSKICKSFQFSCSILSIPFLVGPRFKQHARLLNTTQYQILQSNIEYDQELNKAKRQSAFHHKFIKFSAILIIFWFSSPLNFLKDSYPNPKNSSSYDRVQRWQSQLQDRRQNLTCTTCGQQGFHFILNLERDDFCAKFNEELRRR